MRKLSHQKSKQIYEKMLYACNDIHRYCTDTQTICNDTAKNYIPFKAFNNTFYLRVDIGNARYNSPNLNKIEYTFSMVEDGDFKKVIPNLDKKFYSLDNSERICYNSFYTTDVAYKDLKTEEEFFNITFANALEYFEEQYKEIQENLRKRSRSAFTTLKHNMSYFDKYLTNSNGFSLLKKHLSIMKETETYEDYFAACTERRLPFSHLFAETISLVKENRNITINNNNVASLRMDISIDLSNCQIGKVVDPQSVFKVEQYGNDFNDTGKNIREMCEKVFIEQIPALVSGDTIITGNGDDE